MSLKTKFAIGSVALLVAGGSVTGVALASGNASATPSGGAVGSSSPAQAPEVTTPGDPGPVVQSGPQSGPDSTVADMPEGPSTESASETSAPSDGPGGNQDPIGNVDHQSTTER